MEKALKNKDQVKGNYILTASKFVAYANQYSLLEGYNYLNNQI